MIIDLAGVGVGASSPLQIGGGGGSKGQPHLLFRFSALFHTTSQGQCADVEEPEVGRESQYCPSQCSKPLTISA